MDRKPLAARGGHNPTGPLQGDASPAETTTGAADPVQLGHQQIQQAVSCPAQTTTTGTSDSVQLRRQLIQQAKSPTDTAGSLS